MADRDLSFKSLMSVNGANQMTNGFTIASKTMQNLAEEVTLMSRQSFEQATQVMDDLRSARTLSDVVTIQTKYVKDTFDSFGERVRKVSQLFAEIPAEITKAGQDLAHASAEAVHGAMDVASQSISTVTAVSTKMPPR